MCHEGLFTCVNCGQENKLGDCCQDCAGFDCVVCDKQINFDEEVQVTKWYINKLCWTRDREDLNLEIGDKICTQCFLGSLYV